ncbi:MAG: porin family protein [Bacteroidota bacterium]
MRKILFTAFTLFAVFNLTSAQVESGFGIRAGLGLSKYSVSADGVSVNFGTDPKIFIRGVYVSPVTLGGAIQLEAGYSGRGIDISDDSSLGFIGGEINFDYFDFGAFYRQQFGAGSVAFFVLGGPLVSYALSGNEQSGGEERDIDFDNDGINRLDVGIEIGAGILFGTEKNIALEIRYGNGFVDLAEDIEGGSFTHSAFSFGLGIFF